MSATADTLARVIALVESNNNPYAIRFEPAVYARFPDSRASVISILRLIAQSNDCNQQTAEIIYSMSWGMYQLMGFNVYVQGWTRSIALYLNNVEAQTLSFQWYLEKKNLPQSWDAVRSDIEHFAILYNGPSLPNAYVRRMLEAARSLSV